MWPLFVGMSGGYSGLELAMMPCLYSEPAWVLMLGLCLEPAWVLVLGLCLELVCARMLDLGVDTVLEACAYKRGRLWYGDSP